MTFQEVLLQTLVVFVEVVFVKLVAEVTRQVHSVQMLLKLQLVKVELLTEVAPRMRQDFSALFSPRVPVLNVVPQLLNVIDTLLSYKDCSAG